MLFPWVKTDYLEKNFQKVIFEQRFLCEEIMKLVYLGLVEVQTVKIIFLTYVGRVFEHFTKKNQRFERFKNFQRLRVFVLSYRASSKRRKRPKI